MKLYSWWRSQASFRVRIALHFKGLEAETVPVDIARSEHLRPGYRGLNHAGALPALIDGDGPPLVQSLAILEYLDERYPQPPLLPPDPAARAHARSLAYVAAVDAHPYIVPRVKKYLERELSMNEAQWTAWLRHWLDSATQVLEERLSGDARTGRFCCGDAPTLADICLVPHVVSAKLLYDADLSRYPTVRRIYETCMSLDAFAKAHPRNQPDTPIDLRR
jgi:maleylacetoacetate isomerase/maleylpyruvate isomerase